MACSTSMAAVFDAAGVLGTRRSRRRDVWRRRVDEPRANRAEPVALGLAATSNGHLEPDRRARRPQGPVIGDIGLHIPSIKNRATGKSMGEHCEEMAKEWDIPRERQDRDRAR